MKNIMIRALIALVVTSCAAMAAAQDIKPGSPMAAAAAALGQQPTPPHGGATIDNFDGPPQGASDPLRSDTPAQGTDVAPQAQNSSSGSAAAQAAAQDPWASRAEIEKHIAAARELNVKGGESAYGVCYTAPSGSTKSITLRYNTAAEKARIQRWIREDFDRLLRERHPILETLPRIFEDLQAEVRKVRGRVDALEIRANTTDGTLTTIKATADTAKATADTALGVANANSGNEISVGVNWWTVWFIALTVAIVALGWRLFGRFRGEG